MIQIKTLEQTCSACPSQWEGRTEDDRYVYIRFRWGHLSASIGDSVMDAIDTGFRDYHGDGRVLYSKQISDDLDGFITTEAMMLRLGGVLGFDRCESL